MVGFSDDSRQDRRKEQRKPADDGGVRCVPPEGATHIGYRPVSLAKVHLTHRHARK